MQELFFWKKWLKDYLFVWYFSVGVFVLTILFLWFSYFRGADGVIRWVKLQEQKVIETTVHSFHLGPFELSVPGDNYVVFEYFHGSDIIPNTNASYFFLVVLIISSVIILAVISTIEKFWYFVGMGFFILFVVSLRLEVLGIFGLYNRAPVVAALVCFVAPSFYFNRVRTTFSFLARLLVFGALAIVLTLIIKFFSEVEYPFYHLTLTGYTSGLILTVLFIITVAHDVFASFVNMVSRGTTKSLRHFSIISIIYIGNLLITCFHEMGIIEWRFVYINLYLLLTCSAVVGIWGFRQREMLYKNILPFSPFGAYFFLALAAICFATTGQLIGNHNDPALKIIRDAIIFSHTAYGVIFLTYVFSNFVLMMARNLPVYKVLYNPTRMPYFTYRFAGMIAMLAFIFYSNWRGYVYNGLSGFYNTAGDLYILLGNDAYAESFYEQGRSQGFQNNRSNYALATMKAARLNMEGAHFNYQQANARRPTLFSLTNAGNVYLWENDIFGAIREYRHADEILHGNSIVDSNLGYAYAKVHNLDSALVYLSRAREDSFTKVAAETNFIALAAMELLPLKIDSVAGLFDPSPSVIANALALSTLQGQKFGAEIHPLSNKRLNLYTATLLNNYIIKYSASIDTAFSSRAYAMASDSVNSDFSEAIKSSLAFAYYAQGNVSRALDVLAELAYITQRYQGKFNYIMGLWALEQRNPALASSYFSFADTYDYKDARFYNAIALTEAGKTPEALMAWDSLANGDDEDLDVIAAQMKNVLLVPYDEVNAMGDAEKYQFCRYRIGLRDSLTFNRVIGSFENDNFKAQAILDFSKKYFEADQLVPAFRYLSRIASIALTNKSLFDEARRHELMMLSYSGDVRRLKEKMDPGIVFGTNHRLEELLCKTMIAESRGDTVTAKKNYEILGTYNPYLEEAIIAAANFFRDQPDSGLKPYTILAEAIQINANSIRLLKAYAAEAARQGLEEYALSASERLVKLEASLN